MSAYDLKRGSSKMIPARILALLHVVSGTTWLNSANSRIAIQETHKYNESRSTDPTSICEGQGLG
jgi:hypothetical protein